MIAFERKTRAASSTPSCLARGWARGGSGLFPLIRRRSSDARAINTTMNNTTMNNTTMNNTTMNNTTMNDLNHIQLLNVNEDSHSKHHIIAINAYLMFASGSILYALYTDILLLTSSQGYSLVVM